MGAWGTGAFENDDAVDWLAQLTDEGAGIVRQTFDEVLRTAPAYVERDVGARTVAAAELVAALQGRPGHDLPPELIAWLAAHSHGLADARLVEDAQRALTCAVDAQISELAELWADTPDAHRWQRGVADLRARLA